MLVDDGVPAPQELEWVPDFFLPTAPVVMGLRRALDFCELEAGGRLVYPDTGRMVVVVLLRHGLRLRRSRQQRQALRLRIIFRVGVFFIFIFIFRTTGVAEHLVAKVALPGSLQTSCN